MTINPAQFRTHLLGLGWQEGTEIALAVSGGADSLCMTLLMQQIGAPVLCLIVDHGLRRESSEEAERVQAFLAAQSIQSVILQWQRYEESRAVQNLHHQARQARYHLLLSYCMQQRIKHLATAHNKCDQAENILLRIARGTGIDGLAKIQASKVSGSITILRPMLEQPRTAIERTLLHHGWKWINDPANDDVKFSRTKIRRLLQASGDHGLTVNKLCLLASNASRASSYLKQQAQKHFEEICCPDRYGAIFMYIKPFRELHQEMQLRLINIILRHINRTDYTARLKSLELLLNRIESETLWRDTTLHGCEIVKISPHQLLFVREKKCVQLTCVTNPSSDIIWDNRVKIRINKKTKEAVLIQCLDEVGWRFIRNQSNFSEVKIHHKIKMTLPTLSIGQKIIACPLLNWSQEEYNVQAELLDIL